MSEKPAPRIFITYCTQCQWLLRAAWMPQELLSTFGNELGEVTLKPDTGGVFQDAAGVAFHLRQRARRGALKPDTGGVFQIACGELIRERKRDGGFPDAKSLKQRVRDRIEPGRDLVYIDGLQAPADIGAPAPTARI